MFVYDLAEPTTTHIRKKGKGRKRNCASDSVCLLFAAIIGIVILWSKSPWLCVEEHIYTYIYIYKGEGVAGREGRNGQLSESQAAKGRSRKDEPE